MTREWFASVIAMFLQEVLDLLVDGQQPFLTRLSSHRSHCLGCHSDAVGFDGERIGRDWPDGAGLLGSTSLLPLVLMDQLDGMLCS